MSNTVQPTHRERFASTVMRLCRDLGDRTGGSIQAGEIAWLRREDGARSPTFYKVVATLLDDVLAEYTTETVLSEAERRWARIVHLCAMTAGQHQLGTRFGTALAEADVAEARFLRLVRAEGDGFDAAARAALAPLVQKATSFDPLDLAALVLSAPHPSTRFHYEDGEQVRRRLSRDYYRGLHRASAPTS